VPEYFLLYRQEYPHRLLFAGLYFMDSQLCGVAPSTKLHHSSRSVSRSIRSVPYFEQGFEPCHMMLNKVKEMEAAYITAFLLKKTQDWYTLVTLPRTVTP
jgi:chlorite dismutase